jgi:hypothetical protein
VGHRRASAGAKPQELRLSAKLVYHAGLDGGAMPYSRKQVAALKAFRTVVTDECSDIVVRYAARQYTNGKAKEYATHAFGRRIYILLRCVDRIFAIIPPGARKRPHGNRVDDVIINLQAFIFNAFGCLDNLAWIWVIERDVLGKDGKPLKDARVGFGIKYTEVQRSLSLAFKDEMRGFENWLSYLEGFRHALAHRIPLYVPPFIITPAHEAEFQALEQSAEEAHAGGDYSAFFQAKSKLLTVGVFEPMMTHSFGEGAPHIHYHHQVLTDLKTISHIASRLLTELNNPTL